MTKAEIKFILDELGEETDEVIVAESIKRMTFEKKEHFLSSIDSARIKFDLADEVIYTYKCKPTNLKESDIPSDWALYENYDIYDDKIYMYLFDKETLEPIYNVYDFDTLKLIEAKGV